jgi:hypothetical protein
MDCLHPCSRQREIIEALVVAIHGFDDLHEDVVDEGAGAEAEEVRREPVVAKGFADHDEVMQRHLGIADAPGGFHTDADAGGVKIIADGFEHHERDGHGRGGVDLAGGGLDEIAAGFHRDLAGDADIVVSDEFAGFENDFQVRGAAGFFRRGDFVENFRVIAGEEGATVDDHVDLVSAIGDGAADFLELRPQRHLAAGKTGGDRRDMHGRRIAEKSPRVFDHVRINADRAAGGNVEFSVERLQRLAAKIRDFAGRIFALERRQVHHGDGHFEAGELGAGLDATLGERRGAFLDHDLVHGRKRQSGLARGFNGLGQGKRGHNTPRLLRGYEAESIRIAVAQKSRSGQCQGSPVCRRSVTKRYKEHRSMPKPRCRARTGELQC